LSAGPVAAAYLNQEFLAGSVHSWLAILAGSILCASVSFFVANVIDQIGFRKLASTISLTAIPEVPECYPIIHRTGPRQTCRDTSVGMLQILDNGFKHQGNNTRIEVSWRQIRSLRLTYFGLFNIPAMEGCVSWLDSDSGKLREFRFSSIGGRTQFQANEAAYHILTEIDRARLNLTSRILNNDSETPHAVNARISGGRLSTWATFVGHVLLGLVVLLFLVFFTHTLAIIVAKATGVPPVFVWFADTIFVGQVCIGIAVSRGYRLWMNHRLQHALEVNNRAAGEVTDRN